MSLLSKVLVFVKFRDFNVHDFRLGELKGVSLTFRQTDDEESRNLASILNEGKR